MPLTLTITEGLVPKEKEKGLFKDLCDLMLKLHGILGNKVMTPNVVGSINRVSKEDTFTGGENDNAAFIEWKVPGFVFSDREVQSQYVKQATDLVNEATGGVLAKNLIWVNVIHAVDGAWGINADALTNDQIIEAISQG
jgi:hypothetical protein